MPVTALPDEAYLHAEIDGHRRRRLVGAYLSLGVAMIMFIGAGYSQRMMHGTGWSAATGTIVSVEPDPAGGETEMTSEFVDAAGTTHRDRQPVSFHSAPGEPEVGQRIEYLYKTSELTGDLQAAPRADRILQWILGIPAIILLVASAVVAWLVLRQRNLRRRLVRSGHRVAVQLPAIGHKTVSLPGGVNGGRPMVMWRLEGRFFDATRGEYVDCHSEWLHTQAPVLRDDTPLSPMLVDPDRPSRYWMPLGPLSARSGS